MTTRNTLHLALTLALLAACRDRNNGTPSSTVSTTVPTTVQPTVLQPPPVPVMPVQPAPNALADGGVAPVVAPPLPPTVPVATADVPGTPVAQADDAGAAPATRHNDPTVNIPSPVEGVPGVRVRQRHHGTNVNVGGIQINIPQ